MKVEASERTIQDKDGKVTWTCPARCACKRTKMGDVTIQLMKDCERNPRIKFEEIEI